MIAHETQLEKIEVGLVGLANELQRLAHELENLRTTANESHVGFVNRRLLRHRWPGDNREIGLEMSAEAARAMLWVIAADNESKEVADIREALNEVLS